MRKTQLSGCSGLVEAVAVECSPTERPITKEDIIYHYVIGKCRINKHKGFYSASIALLGDYYVQSDKEEWQAKHLLSSEISKSIDVQDRFIV